MIVLLFGTDQLGVRRRLDELRAQADGGTGMLSTNLVEVDGRQARPDDILGPAMAMPFLAPHRLVLVDSLLDRFQRQPNDLRPPPSTEPLTPLFRGIEAGLPPTTMLVFLGGRVEPRGNDLIQKLGKLSGVTLEHFPELKREDLQRFIRDEAATHGMRIEPAAARRLGDLSSGDTLLLANELSKLALYTMGRPVTEADVDLLCSGEREARIFDFTDAVTEGDLPKALSALPSIYAAGGAAEGVMAMVLAEFRRLASVAELIEAGAADADILRETRLQPWMLDRARKRIRRLGGVHGIQLAFSLIIQADRASKTFVVRSEPAVELLAYRLCALGAPTSAPRPGRR